MKTNNYFAFCYLSVNLPTSNSKRQQVENELITEGVATIDEGVEILISSYERAQRLSEMGLEHINEITSLSKDQWINAWNNDYNLRYWFGAVNKKKQIKKVQKRLKSVNDRLNNKITIRLRPRKQGVSAQNNGTFFEPKTFKVFTNIFHNDIDTIASIMIHELIHLWFFDQKLHGTKVYGAANAARLALEKPRKARKSAENYEHYCLSFA